MKIIIIIFSLLFVASNLFSQIACPPASMCGPWTAKHIKKDLTVLGLISADIWYRQRTCNGVIEYLIDSVHANDNAKLMDSVDYLHFDFSSFTELVLINMIEDTDNIFGTTTPDCGTDTSTVAHFYTASCGVWVKCSYKIDLSSRVCDTCYEAPYPDFKDGQDDWVHVYKWQSCGEVCCKRSYRICKDGWYIKITNYNKEKIGNCSDEGTFKDWRDGSVIPCKNGC